MTEFLREIDTTGLEAATPAPQPAPQLAWLKITDLVIDDRYQRPLTKQSMRVIKGIANDFQWSRFSPVLTAPVEGGRYAIIDGQHRTHAAALCGFEAVPAMVALVAPNEQALAFIQVNSAQIKVRGVQIYRAALAAGEDWAVRSREAVSAAGCHLMTFNASTNKKAPGQIYGPVTIRNLIEAGHDSAVTAGLAALMEYDPSSIANFSADLLTPWLWAVAAYPVDAATLLAALRTQRPWMVLENATRIAKEEGKPIAVYKRRAFEALIANAIRQAAA